MASTTSSVKLPRSTGGLNQYRIVCCAPYRHQSFIWSKEFQSGYNALYELDLPENFRVNCLVPVPEDSCETKLKCYAEKYIRRTWRLKKNWKFVCEIRGDHHEICQVSEKQKLSMILLERPVHNDCWSKLRFRKGDMPRCFEWGTTCLGTRETEAAARERKGELDAQKLRAVGYSRLHRSATTLKRPSSGGLFSAVFEDREFLERLRKMRTEHRSTMEWSRTA